MANEIGTEKKEYDIGACDVFFKAAAATSEVNLGHTSGGVKLKVAYETQEIAVDQLLDPVDEIITKRTITITASFLFLGSIKKFPRTWEFPPAQKRPQFFLNSFRRKK